MFLSPRFSFSMKPTLKKVSKYENKFAKLQKKAAEFNFRNQLKQVKKKEFTLEEEDKEVRIIVFQSHSHISRKTWKHSFFFNLFFFLSRVENLQMWWNIFWIFSQETKELLQKHKISFFRALFNFYYSFQFPLFWIYLYSFNHAFLQIEFLLIYSCWRFLCFAMDAQVFLTHAATRRVLCSDVKQMFYYI